MNNMNEHDKLTQEKFDKWAENFEERGRIFRYFQKRVISLIDFSNPSNFLDLGCGTGWAVRYVSTLLKGEGYFVGTDISENMIIGLWKISIICTFSFHHYLRPRSALAEVRRVLKPGGRIYILDGTPDDFVSKLIEKFAKRPDKTHVVQYSTVEFERMFSQSGLKYLKSKTILLYPIKVHNTLSLPQYIIQVLSFWNCPSTVQ